MTFLASEPLLMLFLLPWSLPTLHFFLASTYSPLRQPGLYTMVLPSPWRLTSLCSQDRLVHVLQNSNSSWYTYFIVPVVWNWIYPFCLFPHYRVSSLRIETVLISIFPELWWHIIGTNDMIVEWILSLTTSLDLLCITCTQSSLYHLQCLVQSLFQRTYLINMELKWGS